MPARKLGLISLTFMALIIGSLVPPILAQSPSARYMSNAGQPVTINLSQFPPLSGIATSNIRIAIFDGSRWSEIPYEFKESTAVLPSLPSNSSTSVAAGSTPSNVGGTLTFLMPQPFGQGAPTTNWWSIATDFGLTSRFKTTFQDRLNSQKTVLYLYYKADGLAPAPDYPFLTVVGSDLASANATQASPNTEPGTDAFTVVETSAPETSQALAPLAAAASASTIYHREPVMNPDPDTIQYPGPGSGYGYPAYNPKTYRTEMPSSRSYTHIIVSGSSTNDKNEYGNCPGRYVWVFTNGIRRYVNIAYNCSFYFDLDASSWLNNGVNTVGLEVTTFVGSWSVHMHVNVQYTASSELTNAVNAFAPNYSFQNTGYTIKYFTAGLPNSTVSPTYLQVKFTSYGDNYNRFWAVFVNGQQISPSGATTLVDMQSCGGSSRCWTSPDITNRMAYQKTVQVGIYLTTYTTNWYWQIWGNINFNTRYQVWPDNDGRWTSSWHPLGTMTATLYDTNAPGSSNWNNLLGPISVALKAQENALIQRFYLGVSTHIAPDRSGMYGGGSDGFAIWHDAHVSISSLSGVNFDTPTLVSSPTNSGTDTNEIGFLVLGGLLVLTSALPPVYAIPAGLGLTFIQYLASQASPCEVYSTGPDSTGVYFSDHRSMVSRFNCPPHFSPYNDLGDQIGFYVNFGGHGSYVVTIQVTVQPLWHFGGGDSGFMVALPAVQFTFTCIYNA